MTILSDIRMAVWGHRRPWHPVTADVEVWALLGDKTPILRCQVESGGCYRDLAWVWNADMALMFIWLSITATWRAPDTWNVPTSANRKSNKYCSENIVFTQIQENIASNDEVLAVVYGDTLLGLINECCFRDPEMFDIIGSYLECGRLNAK